MTDYQKHIELLESINSCDDFWMRSDKYVTAVEAMRTLFCEGATMRKNLAALTVFISDGSRDLNEFAAVFPRTWNAIVTDKPTSFDLPGRVSEELPQSTTTCGTICGICGTEYAGEHYCAGAESLSNLPK